MNISRIKKVKIFIIFLVLLLIPLIISKCELKTYNSINDPINFTTSSTLLPKGIRLTLNDSSSKHVIISWYTEQLASEPKLFYSTSPTLSNNLSLVPEFKIIDGTYLYTTCLKNLEQGQTYYYQIQSDNINKTTILNFTTFAKNKANHYKVLFFGDSRSQREPRREIVNRIIKNFSDISYYFHTGDIVNDGRIQSEWNDYFSDIEPLSERIPGFFIEGNHERLDGKMYDNIFLPTNGQNSYYYSVNFGSVKFIGLNTNRDVQSQKSWLKTELNSTLNDNKTFWKIVFMHEPIFNSRYGRSDRTDLIESWVPLFEKYGVDLVFAGHNHYYERTFPMDQNKEFNNYSLYNFNNINLPIYITTGGAGAPLYDRDGGNPSYVPPSYTAVYNSTYHFMILDIKVDNQRQETSINLETWAMPENSGIYGNLILIDNFSLIKNGLEVMIHSPKKSEVFGHDAPFFNISYYKRNLNNSWYKIKSTWYSLDNGKTIYSFSGNSGFINQSAWDLLSNGSVRIDFYYQDTLNNTYSCFVKIYKDIFAPIIFINAINYNTTLGNNPPVLYYNFTDNNLDSIWYEIWHESNIMLSSFINKSEHVGKLTINQSFWEALPDGIIIFRFYANDTQGNTGFIDIMYIKDTQISTSIPSWIKTTILITISIGSLIIFTKIIHVYYKKYRK